MSTYSLTPIAMDGGFLWALVELTPEAVDANAQQQQGKPDQGHRLRQQSPATQRLYD